ncbi:hypothetical protein [Actinokineospora sp. NBRC 105648]|uniref:hypothetical protein n=1 Tax=Actinokineospora sp. NBRC 105648 TaxID=3032206 RepID=UPI0024A50E1A|nr:hypothetical protein [Actinokineospora sp. NBRC 105648]GLZ42118.1 hypothetical protein Acsp05_57420 [Actinokineospora sp. NBRC 105648]
MSTSISVSSWFTIESPGEVHYTVDEDRVFLHFGDATEHLSAEPRPGVELALTDVGLDNLIEVAANARALMRELRADEVPAG